MSTPGFEEWHLAYRDGKPIPDTMYEWLRESYTAGYRQAVEDAANVAQQNRYALKPDDNAVHAIRKLLEET